MPSRITRLPDASRAFQKKAKSDIATPKRDLDLLERRLRAARKHYEEYYAEKK